MSENMFFGKSLDFWADIIRFNGVPYQAGTPIEDYTLTLTNSVSSARTEGGTAAIVRVQKFNNMVYLTFYPQSIATVSAADAQRYLTFNEVLPVAYRFDDSPIPLTQLQVPCFAVNDNVTNASLLQLDASGHFTIYADFSASEFTNASLVGVPFQSISMSYPTSL